eukprot:snap_masked-scaffold_6-processed-gene-7.34-mRNA-1 protein AED:1.00 eAED:1.00 QI:0/0/0/0/1/1/2/0/246
MKNLIGTLLIFLSMYTGVHSIRITAAGPKILYEKSLNQSLLQVPIGTEPVDALVMFSERINASMEERAALFEKMCEDEKVTCRRNYYLPSVDEIDLKWFSDSQELCMFKLRPTELDMLNLKKFLEDVCSDMSQVSSACECNDDMILEMKDQVRFNTQGYIWSDASSPITKLDVTENATVKEIKSAQRKIVRYLHPDTSSLYKSERERRLVLLNEAANDLLKIHKSRRVKDELDGDFVLRFNPDTLV